MTLLGEQSHQVGNVGLVAGVDLADGLVHAGGLF